MVAPLIAGALIGGASSLVGDALGMVGQHQANQANKGMAREQMAFQERMSSTAYQRAMADMKKAGLNPMLAYQQGGATTPSGSTATMQNIVPPGVGQKAMASASEALRMKNERTIAESTKDKLDQDTRTSSMTERLLRTQNEKESYTARAIAAGLPRLEAEMRFWNDHGDKLAAYDAVSGRILPWAGMVGGTGIAMKLIDRIFGGKIPTGADRKNETLQPLGGRGGY